MNKKVLLFLSVILVLIGAKFVTDFFAGNNNDVINNSTIEADYSGLLTAENYKKVGINPEEFDTYEDFLKYFKDLEGVEIDPFKEDFVIGKKTEDNKIIYIPFDKDRIKDSNITSGDMKNLAILDIYGAYKDKSIFGGYDSKQGGKIIFQKDIVHKETKILNEVLLLNTKLYDLRDELESVKNLDTGKKELLSYLDELEGNYDEAEERRKETCKVDPKSCKRITTFTLKGKVLDDKGNPIPNAKIIFLNDNKITFTSDSEGNYFFEKEFPALSHIRFKATKLGYSDAYMNFSLNTSEYDNWKSKYTENFTLLKSNANYSIDLVEERKKEGEYFVVDSSQSKYFIPKNGLKHFNGAEYKGDKVDIYLYEFRKDSSIEHLMNNDTFNPVYGYVGNLMKTFGMPYIQFINPENNEELFIMSSNPMILQNQIYHMKELYENFDQIYEALSDEDMKFLVEKSNELGGFPIDFDFLIEYRMLRWPAWWALDRKVGIWNNIGCRVVNEGGLVEMEFYSIKDN